MTTPSLIAADWGTTNFRLFLYDEAGKVIARHAANIGLKNLGVLTFEQALLSVLKDEFAGLEHLPFLLSGMVGSRQGWVEAPYAACPADLQTLVDGLVRAPSEKLDVSIVPGLFAESPGTGLLNVMRGEETQIFGLLKSDPTDGFMVLPGTHSKWALIRDGQVQSFSTHMTGEMFQVLKAHSILGVLMENSTDNEEAFLKGIERGMYNRAFLSVIFSVRTEALFNNIAPAHLSAYLSGILIGSEIIAELERHGPSPVRLVGDGALVDLYEKALAFAGFKDVTRFDGNAASEAGLWAIHKLRTAQ
ncbi:2-dehydro-3-deoxygalactonokinase [Asticcacaulis sp. BYS171W]|uniref:2-dehydro-3-deoxygalactonokinase n=1 Tax=Asticcacaulis aquaticus TaxID=2984212 RepID=A0ABT5HR03_9CAUL|nr:2-dehydro-3-deoxygalactonokinase [Asticcacaulis aquaticus]MDC7682250.1 2-dehydro-3-deoxygalactonokinase [Asticcacaulis aquaticus]